MGSFSMRRHMLGMILEHVAPCMDFHPGLRSLVMDLQVERARLEEQHHYSSQSPSASRTHLKPPSSSAAENPHFSPSRQRCTVEREREEEENLWSADLQGAGIGVLPGRGIGGYAARETATGAWGNPWQRQEADGRVPEEFL